MENERKGHVPHDKRYAITVLLSGKKKYVYVDEASIQSDLKWGKET